MIDATPKVLLVEDDEGDAVLIEALLEEAGEPFALLRARTVAEAVGLVADVGCVLLDLGLPDAEGFGALERLLERSPEVAIVVLTGLVDAAAGERAVSKGAQDYLVKGEVDGAVLGRSVRYAIERRRAQRNAARLRLAEQRQAENARLSRGLLPKLLIDGSGLSAATRYRPGGIDAVLGGDFYDAVCLPDGTVRAVIGDVCGHGPDEAAIGVGLRIAWRALIRAGVEAGPVLAHLDELLGVESAETTFATVCDIEIPPDRSTMTVRLAGHPPPLLLQPEVRWLEEVRPGPPLGVQLGNGVGGPPTTLPLPDRWALVLVTDGLFEGRTAAGRLGMDGLAGVASGLRWDRDDPGRGLDALLAAVDEATEDDHADDVAVLYLAR